MGPRETGKVIIPYHDNNSQTQANSGFRLLRSYTFWLHLEYVMKDSHLRPIQAFTDTLKRYCGRSDSPCFGSGRLWLPLVGKSPPKDLKIDVVQFGLPPVQVFAF
jgi:hypothetical protein